MQVIDLENKLLEKQITPTAMRLRVLEFFTENEIALSIADIESGLGNSDRVTIYRTLKTFEEHCIVHSIDDGSGTTKYGLCDGLCEPGGKHKDAHVHFHCVVCDQTTCIDIAAWPQIQLPSGYSQQNVSLNVRGVCEQCNLDT